MYSGIIKLKRFLRNCVDSAKIIAHYCEDCVSYLYYSAKTHWPRANKDILEARITAISHTIEKALSFRDCRPGFGKTSVLYLIELLEDYKRRFLCENSSSNIYSVAVSSLHKYIDHAKGAGLDFDSLSKKIAALGNDCQSGGVIQYTQKTWEQNLNAPFDQFAFARHSVRDFTNESVSDEKIRLALEMAQSAPSACNRQSCRVYVVKNDRMIGNILSMQGGARGFDHMVKSLLVISYNEHSWSGVLERNQGYIDGGIYGMNLLYGLHKVGLGACPLIWGRGASTSRKLRAVLGMPPNENIVLLIATGGLPEEFKVALSARKPIGQVARFILEDV